MTEKQPETDWQRKRRLAEVFGDVLPDTTERRARPGRPAGEAKRGDTWLEEQVPPHHGG